MIHKISSDSLTLKSIYNLVFTELKLELSDEAKSKINKCRDYLEHKLNASEEPVYGINTGFGSLCNVKISKDNLSKLQENLVMSHACGTGELVPKEIVKLMLFLKIQSLSYGHSGIRLETVERLVSFYSLIFFFFKCVLFY